MCVGEIRQMIMPPALAYGADTEGPIPANSNLESIVELEDILDK